MSFGVPIFQRSFTTAFLFAAGFSRAFAGASLQTDQPILFSAPEGSALTTNINQLTIEKSRPNESFPSLHPFGGSAGTSLGPAAARPPMIQNSGIMDLLNRQKDLEAATPEEAMRNLMARELFSSRSGSSRSKSDSSDLEDFLKMTRSGGATNSSARNKSAFSQRFNDADDRESNPFTTSPSGMVNSDRSLLAPAFGSSQGLQNFLGANRQPESPAAATVRFQQEQQSQLEQFKKILDGSSLAPMGPFTPASLGNVPAAQPLSTVSGGNSGLDPLLGVAGPGATAFTPRTPTVQDLIPRARAPITPTAPGPPLDPSKASASSSRPKTAEPSFDAPMRRF